MICHSNTQVSTGDGFSGLFEYIIADSDKSFEAITAQKKKEMREKKFWPFSTTCLSRISSLTAI